DAGRADGAAGHRALDGRSDPGAVARRTPSDPRWQRQARARALVRRRWLPWTTGGRTPALDARERVHTGRTRARLHAGHHGSRRHHLHACASRLPAVPAAGGLHGTARTAAVGAAGTKAACTPAHT